MAVTADMQSWLGAESEIGVAVEKFSRDCLNAYKADPRRVTEDANIERVAIEGGYARRQLYELVQNGADELLDARGRIAVIRTADALYCANQGKPVSERGVGALLASNLSPKAGFEIGRFGLGFKSVLGVTTMPAIFSQTGSFHFDRSHNEQRIRRVVSDAERVAVLRLARPLDPRAEAEDDPVLAELMQWAVTVVRCPLDVPARHGSQTTCATSRASSCCSRRMSPISVSRTESKAGADGSRSPRNNTTCGRCRRAGPPRK